MIVILKMGITGNYSISQGSALTENWNNGMMEWWNDGMVEWWKNGYFLSIPYSWL